MLHGEVKINGDGVVRWSARRKQRCPEASNDYEVEAALVVNGGVTKARATVMRHRYEDGAAALASEVLAWVATWERTS